VTVAVAVFAGVPCPAGTEVTAVPKGTSVGEGRAVGVFVGDVVGVTALVGWGVKVAWATGVPVLSAPGFRMSTNPTRIRPIKQNASKMIKGMANLRLASIPRRF
jgi:hypothetical protein